MTVVILKLHRKGGSKVELFGKNYMFKPASGDGMDDDIEHTCDIPDEDAKALYRLLSITDAYVLKDPNAKLPARPKAEPGQTIGNEKPPAIEVKPIIISDGEKEIDLTLLSPEALRVLARDTFGITVHHKWADQTVIAKIIEKTRGE